jgi:hypothetical protein
MPDYPTTPLLQTPRLFERILWAAYELYRPPSPLFGPIRPLFRAVKPFTPL